MFQNSLIRWIGAGSLRGMVLLAAIAIGALWADRLLQTGHRATDLLMTASDLQQLTAADDDQSDRASETAEALPAAAASGESDAAAAEPTGARPPDERAEAAPSADSPPASASTAAAAGGDRTDPIPPIEELGDRVPDFGGEGTLQSFSGQTHLATEGLAPTGMSGNGPQWTIRFDRALTAERLSAVTQTRLVVVRQRRGGAECLPVVDGQLGSPQMMDDWLRQHPEYAGRRGILLPRTWFREFDDRLLTRGGGWQFWLLVEDTLFAQWIRQVAEQLAARQATWDRLQHIDARLTLVGGSGPPNWRLQVKAVETDR